MGTSYLILIISPFCRIGNWGSKRLSNLPEHSQFIRGRSRTLPNGERSWAWNQCNHFCGSQILVIGYFPNFLINLIKDFLISHAAAAKSFQLCPTLCNPIDGSPPGCPIPGIFQARTLEWVAISFSNAGKWKVKVKSFSHIWLFATPWTAAHQALLSMGFSRQEYWSGVPLPSPIQMLVLPNFIR